ncbi:unnamed protein product [Spirodela intermedia]|uniref:Uncharacterized protein n=1 Tax=Spirodela intermedia TaxID=51605 RepID=A0A7I8IEB2_SPIIN|nr:unnamed protein product [Spirodela intermedia]CAA6656127.1 unnamed protein product [Spirodela intermedia]
MPLAPYSQPIHQQQHLLSPHPKRHQSMADTSCQITPRIPGFNATHDLFLRRHQQTQQQQQQQSFESLHVLPCHSPQPRPMKPKIPGDETPPAAPPPPQQPQALVDQLFEAAELIESGNLVNAREILARLNHQLSPVGKPLLRSAFYCKEALRFIISKHSSSIHPSSSPPMQRNPLFTASSSPLDVVLKLSAYKAFSEISPLLQFANFTCTQALLEELSGCDRIHIIDFDIGVGGQWSSFMQELAQRRCAATATTPSLRLTAFAPLASYHPFEVGLTRENLSHFASELNIPFEFNILSVDSFDPASLLSMSHGGETIAVNLPACSLYHSVPGLLRLVKQLSPKIVVCVDHGWDHSDFTFSRHFLHVLQSATMLLDSIDAACGNPEVVNKIERYLLQPRIQNSLLGRLSAAEKAVPLWNMFASAGLVPLSFSNFTETQAECLMKRIQVRGFHVEKRQSSLLLCWQRGGLASVSAWSC